MNEPQAYIPGMCNINTAEVAYRKKAMWFGIILTIVPLGLMIVFSLPLWTRLILIAPIFVASIGYLQAKNKFCVAYGASGRQNATDGQDAAVDVTEAAALAADKKKARDMNLQALIISIVATLLLLLIPNIA